MERDVTAFDAEEETVEIVENHAPRRFIIENGILTGMEFDRLEWTTSTDGKQSSTIIETVISRLIDFYETKDGAPVPPSAGGGTEKVRQFNPASPPSLTHTKVLTIEFCGKPLDHGQANWNGLLNAVVRVAKARAKSASELKQLVIIPFVDGHKVDEGYRVLSDIGISIQGQDANGAWKAAYHIAQRLGLKLVATFVWREKEGAAFPGVTGRLSVADH